MGGYHDCDGGDGWNPYVRIHSLFGPDNAHSLANEGRLPNIWAGIMRDKRARLRKIYTYTPEIRGKLDTQDDNWVYNLEKRLGTSMESLHGVGGKDREISRFHVRGGVSYPIYEAVPRIQINTGDRINDALTSSGL